MLKLRQKVAILAIGLLACGCLWAAEEQKEAPVANPVVVIETSEGTIKVELFADKAPKTVENFLKYVDEKFYDGTIFHRVIKDFMIQGGGMTADMNQKATHSPVKNEARADVPNKRGAIAMARTGVVDSATAQFFINVVNNDGSERYNLDHQGNDPDRFGYCVFGKVIGGMDVVDKIRAVATGPKGPFPSDVPQTTMLIKSVRRADAATAAVKYPCPMKCEGDKTYDKPGICPVCKMQLKPVTAAAPK